MRCIADDAGRMSCVVASPIAHAEQINDNGADDTV
jgi:hypothetical protein